MKSLSDGERAVLAQDGPEEEAPGFRVLDYQLIKAARKHHFCSLCEGGWIAPGESYARFVMLDDGGGVTVERSCDRKDVPCSRAATTQHWIGLALDKANPP